ncbi:hypothetical protein CI102_4987 [Trichoderma harzianum]|nr:hypothetical protein CI102_4987 [Trichoderma harzianum]
MRNFTPECTLPPNGTYGGHVHGVNTRSTLEIVWSCIGIIILSTWSILHLDLPADVVTKVFWMGLKLFSPEFAATGCARKIFATRSNSAMLERLAHLDGVPWSLKHTILVDMGGIALRFLPPKDGETPTPDQARQRILPDNKKRPQFIKDFCRRQNRLLKWCGKIPWDLWECHVQHASDMEKGIQPSTRAESQEELTFSEADVAALAGNIWILDSKQLAIARKRGIITEMPKIKEEAIDDKSKSDGLVKIIAVLQVLWLVVQLVVRTIEDLHFTQLEITTVAFAATAVIIYSIDFIKPKDVNVPFYIDVEKAVEYDDFCSWRNPYKLSPKAADIFSLMIGFASATSFGGVHLFAWNSDFPTHVERLLWRISALMTIVLPYIYIATHVPYIGYTVADIRKQMKLPMNIALGCIAICYIPCRLFLVIESFRALYYLPSEAFKATPAVMSIPHLG